MQRTRVYALFYLVLSVMALMVLWAACHPPQRAVSTRRTPTAQITQVTSIEATCVTETSVSSWRGSAVITGPDALVTAEHVVNCPGSLLATAIGEDGAPVLLFVEATAPGLDIASVRTLLPAWPSAGPVSIGPRPDIGDEVCVVSAVPTLNRQCGRVNGRSRNMISHDAFTEPGNSGGGVYDMAGRLVGVTSVFRTCNIGQVCGGGFGPIVSVPWMVQ